MEELETLKRKVNELETIVNALRNRATIPFDIYSAFQDRIGTPIVGTGTINASSKTQEVDEGGSLTYNVAKPMNGFLLVRFNNTNYNIPYYT